LAVKVPARIKSMSLAEDRNHCNDRAVTSFEDEVDRFIYVCMWVVGL
jgi:hypothetical protein